MQSWLDNNEAEIDNQKLPIPKFTIHMAMQHFGNSKSKVETSALVIELAEKDAQHLKTLLNQGYKNGDIQCGTVVPTGIHLTTSPDTYE
eukprot:583706-Ditylum_brightwellii.AAC.1